MSVVLQPGEVQVAETTLERQINQLTPLMLTQHGTEKVIYSWPDLVQKLVLLGVDYKQIGTALSSTSYNFAPPIDLDKFVNFDKYFWIGNIVKQNTTSTSYQALGIPNTSYITPIFTRSNPTFAPEYYVIQRGSIDGSGNPIQIDVDNFITTWTDWSLANLWVHLDDVAAFITNTGSTFSQLVQATRPIIEYNSNIRVNTCQRVGVPTDDATAPEVLPVKTRLNQPPQFDLFRKDGTHAGFTSSIFYYVEGSQYEIDPELQRRIALDANGNYLFEHALVDQTTKELYFYKTINTDSSETRPYDYQSVWQAGPVVQPRYTKYDTSGTLINQDKVSNYFNYFWTGVDTSSQPSYNVTGLPEYYVIETGGTSDWSVYNHWVHVRSLKQADLAKYVQATRPIIEYNVGLESQLLVAKTSYNQIPTFQFYLYDSFDYHTSDVDDLGTYEAIPSSDENLNNAYCPGILVARIQDLPTIYQTAINNTQEVIDNLTCDLPDGEYIQSLHNGYFSPILNDVFYGYTYRVLNYTGVGNGSMINLSCASTCIPELVTFTWNGSTFTVVGSTTGAQPNATIGTPYTTVGNAGGGLTLTLVAGLVAFSVGDTFLVQIRAPNFSASNLFILLNGVYRTVSTPSEIFTEMVSPSLIDANVANGDGVWEEPPQLMWNVQNETRADISQGDLAYHFTSIIAAQPFLIGAANGLNNWRNLTSLGSPPNLGLGGTIKQYDGHMMLFIGILMQQGITINTLLQFAKDSYETLFTAIRSFLVDQIPEMLTTNQFVPPTSGTSIAPAVVTAFQTYFSNVSLVTSASANQIDDYLSTIFFDTTSGFNNLVATLPYLELSALVAPQVVVDDELNLQMLVHHDGHRTALTTVSQDILKAVVTKLFMRSPGQSTPGAVTGVTAPTMPYMGQFWFQTSTGNLFYYNVISDVGAQPLTAANGAYSYNRTTNTLYQFNGATWTSLGSGTATIALPWYQVRLDLIEQNLTLAVENMIYAACPPITLRISPTTLQANSNFQSNMQSEFEQFGITYGVANVYGSTYDPTNAFTWNYRSAYSQGAWQAVYTAVYGTSRPDLYPWIPAGMTQAALLANLKSLSLISSGITTWATYMWALAGVGAQISSLYVLNGKQAALSTSTSNGALIPPYSTDPQALLTSIPASAASAFKFGENGPIELYWRKTLDYLYSLQKVYYKIDPFNYTWEAWGTARSTLVGSGGYSYNSYLGRKTSAADIMLQGDLLADAALQSWIVVTPLTSYGSQKVFTITCVNRIDNTFKITVDGVTSFFSNIFTSSYISFDMTEAPRGFFWGDQYVVTYNADKSYTVVVVPQTTYRSEGLNQIYVQYGRAYGQDSTIAINTSLLKEWVVKLGYRFAGFINTDTLKISDSTTTVIDPSFYSIYLKENKYYNSAWLNAFRVQLVQVGSTTRVGTYNVPAIGPGGTPGEDWVYRVDLYNNSRSTISWNVLDTTSDSNSFVALNGTRTLYEWSRYNTVVGQQTQAAPFLITGIQNVLNFIFGYVSKLTADGWTIGDPDNPEKDPTTGRPITYQLYVEMFINQQFSNPPVGTAFIFNPFANQVWYQTPHGVVSSLVETIGLEQETVNAVLDSNQNQIPAKMLRVFREDDITEIVFDVPCYTLHILTSEYEHVALFDDYASTILIYDTFLGQIISRVLVNGEKQSTFTGRLDFGGHFLLNGNMKRNIESSVSDLLTMYDSNTPVTPLPENLRARSLLGFQSNDYFAQRGSSDATEFKFWRGMLPNKGTTLAINAYINSTKYQTAELDESWAYKLAEYGDARTIIKTDMNVESDDSPGDLTNYQFEESVADADLVDNTAEFDVLPYDGNAYDSSSVVEQTQILATGITVTPDDEKRWHSYSDLNAIQTFEADVIGTMFFTATTIDGLITVIDDATGVIVNADCFEIFDPNSATQSYYREAGDLIVGSNPPAYNPQAFLRINHCSIQLLTPALLNKRLQVIAYGPAASKYSPIELYDYVSNVRVLDDILWWDPARGIQHPQAHAAIDYEESHDPARYNQTLYTQGLHNSTVAPWGANEVGKYWWNTKNAEWLPYSDTKIYTNMNNRLALWGSLADDSSIDVFEWVKSSTPPAQYSDSTGGVIGITYNLVRNRTWSGRPVGWKYSINPQALAPSFLTYQPVRLKMDASSGYTTAVLKTGTFQSLGIITGTKFSGALYSSPTSKVDSNLTDLFGSAQVVSTTPAYVVGTSSAYDTGPSFATSSLITSFSISLVPATLANIVDPTGAYVLSNETDGAGSYFIRMTAASGATQAIQVNDTPIIAGTQDFYNFDQLGLIVNYTVGYGWIATWPAPVSATNPISSVRISNIAAQIGNVAHNIVLRSSVAILINIPFVDPGVGTIVELSANSDTGNNIGWVAWNDPVVNPNTGTPAPNNNYKPFAGSYVVLSTTLPLLASDIQARQADPWTWFDGIDYSPYKSTWGKYTLPGDTIKTAYFYISGAHTSTAFFTGNFTFTGFTNAQVLAQTSVYVNGVKIPSSSWTVSGVTVTVNSNLNEGDRIKMVLRQYVPNAADLAFNPDVSDPDPMIVNQYKLDSPYVLEVLRDANNQPTVYNYYFWVKHKQTPGTGKTIAVETVRQLLSKHNGCYSVPQVLKYYNQLDGRPNRYTILSFKLLGLYVRARDRYMIRMTRNPTLRNTDNQLALKNSHSEWILIRKFQGSLIPKALWNQLTNTLAGEDQLGQLLPSTPFESYDTRNNTSVRYGIGTGQVLTDPNIAKATMKYIILNTRVNKYINGVATPDYISYPGFDINQLDTYLATPTSIVKFMSDLWRFAKPKQVNEIFFAVLDDAAAKSLELAGLFKTSFITLNDIKVITGQ